MSTLQQAFLTIFAYVLSLHIITKAIHQAKYSDTGAKPPESCVFGQFLNICALLAIMCMYVRFKQVRSLTVDGTVHIQRLNKVCLGLGLTTALGLSVVANFQETSVLPVHIVGAMVLFVGGTLYELLQVETSVLPVHIVGAMVLFVGGTLYELLQVVMSFMMCPNYNGRFIVRMRMVIWFLSFAALVMSTTSAAISRHQGHHPMTFSRIPWKSTDPGYTAHITSTISEWVMAFTFIAFFLTFTREFQKVSLSVNTHLHALHLDAEPVYHHEGAPLLA